MSEAILEKEDLRRIFEDGIKPATEFKTGIEYERLPIRKKNFEAVDYAEINGIKDFLRAFAREENWDYITDDYQIIGLKQNHDTITLEPGCQLELSLEPQKHIEDLQTKIETLDKSFAPILNKMGFKLLEYGVSPVSTYRFINLIPKRRYKVMANYLWGILSDVMMRETAGIQACFDFSSEEDAMRKFRLANLLSPFMTAMYANSPIRGGVDTGYKSFRALSWLNCDSERCGFAGKLEKDFSFDDYINAVLKSPMIYISRENMLIEVRGRLTFEEFMKKGFEGYCATLEDFKLHANLYFPDVRLRKFIEIRNHDCINHGMQYSVLATYKGILYNDDAMSAAEDLLKDLTFEELSELRYDVPKLALDTPLGNKTVKDYAKAFLALARTSLKTANDEEERFLEPVEELVNQGLTFADIIIKNWNGSWNKDINKMIKYIVQ